MNGKEIMLIDFGGSINTNIRYPRVYNATTTAMYNAPELCPHNRSKIYDPGASDVYSLAATLFVLIHKAQLVPCNESDSANIYWMYETNNVSLNNIDNIDSLI